MMENLPKMEEQPAELLFPREGYWLVDILNLNENFINICWWKFKRGKMMEIYPKWRRRQNWWFTKCFREEDVVWCKCKFKFKID